jgi:hypothetical protein
MSQMSYTHTHTLRVEKGKQLMTLFSRRALIIIIESVAMRKEVKVIKTHVGKVARLEPVIN